MVSGQWEVQDLALGFEADLAVKGHLALGFGVDLAVKVKCWLWGFKVFDICGWPCRQSKVLWCHQSPSLWITRWFSPLTDHIPSLSLSLLNITWFSPLTDQIPSHSIIMNHQMVWPSNRPDTITLHHSESWDSSALSLSRYHHYIYVSAFRVAIAALRCRQRDAAVATLKADTYKGVYICICF